MLAEHQRELIKRSKYKDKILYLYNNPELAHSSFFTERGLKEIIPRDGYEDLVIYNPFIHSNCLGTTIHILGLEELFEPHPGNRFPVNEDRPGYVCEGSMFDFILSNQVEEITSLELDCIVIRGENSTERDLFRDYFFLKHSGIYLGDNQYFQQMGLGMPFSVGDLFTQNPRDYPVTRFFRQKH